MSTALQKFVAGHFAIFPMCDHALLKPKSFSIKNGTLKHTRSSGQIYRFYSLNIGKFHLTTVYINTKLQLGIKDKVKQKCCHYGYSSYHFNQNTQENSHWLHPAYSHYDFKFVSGVRDILSVCSLFLFYPVFWALFEQMVSMIFYIP